MADIGRITPMAYESDRWEYTFVRATVDGKVQTVNGKPDQSLLSDLANALGGEGWELVHLIPTGDGHILAVFMRAAE